MLACRNTTGSSCSHALVIALPAAARASSNFFARIEQADPRHAQVNGIGQRRPLFLKLDECFQSLYHIGPRTAA